MLLSLSLGHDVFALVFVIFQCLNISERECIIILSYICNTYFCDDCFNYYNYNYYYFLMVFIWKQTIEKINPLTPMNDQDRISPYNINTISNRQVMRINKNINMGISS